MEKLLLCILLFISLFSCSQSTEPETRYYEKNGEQWVEKKIYCYPESIYPDTKGERKLAKIQQFKVVDSYEELVEEKVFYELWPNGESKFVSEDGFYTYKNGENQLLINQSSIPDNIITESFDANNKLVFFYYQSGQKVPFVKGQMDGVREFIYSSDEPGVYVWKNGQKIFEREFTQQELDAKAEFERKEFK